MKKISFYKMSGSGNDFIIIDNRNHIVPEENLPEFTRKICFRKMSAGADGLVLVENSRDADFAWRFYNSDGSLAEMCGNAARCTARFAYINEIAGYQMRFKTEAGIISAQVTGEQVKVKMTDPADFKDNRVLELKTGPLKFSSVNTGVPHVVIKTEDINSADVTGLGRKIRFHEAFAPAGTNVNFFSIKDNKIFMRTYERGVEDETLACGTGAVAAALAVSRISGLSQTSPVSIIPKSGGPLTVYYKEENGKFYEVYLEGDARIIYEGRLWEDSWTWGKN